MTSVLSVRIRSFLLAMTLLCGTLLFSCGDSDPAGPFDGFTLPATFVPIDSIASESGKEVYLRASNGEMQKSSDTSLLAAADSALHELLIRNIGANGLHIRITSDSTFDVVSSSDSSSGRIEYLMNHSYRFSTSDTTTTDDVYGETVDDNRLYLHYSFYFRAFSSGREFQIYPTANLNDSVDVAKGLNADTLVYWSGALVFVRQE